MNWWSQFPLSLRQVVRIRLLASFGAGGVLYMTPLVFHQVNFSASKIGQGLAASAIIGFISRFSCGLFLDRGLACSWPVRMAAALSIFANFVLVQATGFTSYLGGQLLIGMATGLYFPAIELAVPLSCGNFPSSRGYALARSADALGVAIGASTGVIVTGLGIIRAIYVIDIISASMIILILSQELFINKYTVVIQEETRSNSRGKCFLPASSPKWLLPLIPILILTIVATSTITLRQSALPLDLVRGSLERPPLSEVWSGALIALHLALLMLLQWPVGSWVARRNAYFGLGIGLVSLSLGFALIALSSLFSRGLVLLLLAELPLAFGEAAFLPTAAEAVLGEVPIKHRGLAMALFSQCFAISASTIPLLAGILLDAEGNGLLLWSLAAMACLATLPMLNNVRQRYFIRNW